MLKFSCLTNCGDRLFSLGEQLFQNGAVSELFQIGFLFRNTLQKHLQATIFLRLFKSVSVRSRMAEPLMCAFVWTVAGLFLARVPARMPPFGASMPLLLVYNASKSRIWCVTGLPFGTASHRFATLNSRNWPNT